MSDTNPKLELRLGLPSGDECYYPENSLKNTSNTVNKNSSVSSLHYFSNQNQGLPSNQNPWNNNNNNNISQFVHQRSHVVRKESANNPSCTRIVELQKAENNTAVHHNTPQKRAAPAPVVGWPPIRSFRKNLSNNTLSKTTASPSKPLNENKTLEKSHNKGLFVKINMDGIPIGRKVDLHAFGGYEKLSSAVDELFRGLLAGQNKNSCGGGNGMDNKQEEQKPITGLLDGSGEYTLVYEDNEGDRILVGDVPWHMFISTVKRLRVLKSSDLPTLNRGGSKKGKELVDTDSK